MTKTNLLDKRITVRVDNTRFAELERYADNEGMSVSFLVRHLVYRFIEDFKRQKHTKAAFRAVDGRQAE